MSFDAVELTAAQAWLVADLTGAGEYPWSLAITQPFGNPLVADKVVEELRQELVGLGVVDSDGNVEKRVAAWTRAVCTVRRRDGTRVFEARTVRAGDTSRIGRSGQLRTVVVCGEAATVVAMRAGGLVTLTELGPAHPRTLASILTSGLPGAEPAKFRQFALPTADGARADERLRAGAPPQAVLAGLGLSEEASATLAAMLAGPRSFVEISFGSPAPDRSPEAAVGVGVLDTALGRVLVAPSRTPDGTWLSTFSPGTAGAIAAALAALAGAAPAEAAPAEAAPAEAAPAENTEFEFDRWR